MDLTTIRAIVTGGASGLGAATAQHFRDIGAQVTILDRDPAGEAFATFPPSVPRFWIWAAPIVAAASIRTGRCSRQTVERRISV